MSCHGIIVAGHFLIDERVNPFIILTHTYLTLLGIEKDNSILYDIYNNSLF